MPSTAEPSVQVKTLLSITLCRSPGPPAPLLTFNPPIAPPWSQVEAGRPYSWNVFSLAWNEASQARIPQPALATPAPSR